MVAFEQFEKDLREALAHLYNPLYEPGESLWEVMGIHPRGGVSSVQRAIIREIERLKPEPSVPSDAPICRFHKMLSYRYVQGLTQEAAAERLGIATRYLREQQSKAVRALAKSLWGYRDGDAPLSSDRPAESQVSQADTEKPSAETEDWASQLREELASLQKKTPVVVADVGVAMRVAVELGRTLAAEQSTTTEIDFIESEARALIHPSALRQALLAAITALSRVMSDGAITLSCEDTSTAIRIAITGSPIVESSTIDVSLLRELLNAHHGSVEIDKTEHAVSLRIDLPAPVPNSDTITVLVMDDNEDLVCFYRSYIEGTQYRIVHVPEAKNLFSSIEGCDPDIIVLDIMFPDRDIDGWELLVRLHGHPATRTVPVVVCSVIREEQLALALGATLYLPKPVRRRQFISALDQALIQAAATAPKAASNTAVAC